MLRGTLCVPGHLAQSEKETPGESSSVGSDGSVVIVLVNVIIVLL